MFIVISIMAGGITAGYLLRRKSLAFIQRFTTPLIGLLLFLLGNEVGSNPDIMQNLHTLGTDALIITLGAVAGSILAAWVLWRACTAHHTKKQS